MVWPYVCLFLCLACSLLICEDEGPGSRAAAILMQWEFTVWFSTPRSLDLQGSVCTTSAWVPLVALCFTSNTSLQAHGGSDSKESTCRVGDLGSLPGSGRSPGEGNGNPLQCSCVENPYGQRSLLGYSPRGGKESDVTEELSTAQRWRDWALWPRRLKGRAARWEGHSNGDTPMPWDACAPWSSWCWEEALDGTGLALPHSDHETWRGMHSSLGSVTCRIPDTSRAWAGPSCSPILRWTAVRALGLRLNITSSGTPTLTRSADLQPSSLSLFFWKTALPTCCHSLVCLFSVAPH